MSALDEHIRRRKLNLGGMPEQLATDELQRLAWASPRIALALMDFGYRLYDVCQQVVSIDATQGLEWTSCAISFLAGCLRTYSETMDHDYSFLEAVEMCIGNARAEGSVLESTYHRRDEIVEAQWEGGTVGGLRRRTE